MDYRHSVYLKRLQMRRAGNLRALDRVEQGATAVLYERGQWFRWVRASQNEEEQTREKGREKMEMEAAMFQRHWRKLRSRPRATRVREERWRQDVYLEQVWRKRMDSADDTMATRGSGIRLMISWRRRGRRSILISSDSSVVGFLLCKTKRPGTFQ